MSAPSKGLTKELTVTDVDTPNPLVLSIPLTGGAIAISDEPAGNAFLLETGDYILLEDGEFLLFE